MIIINLDHNPFEALPPNFSGQAKFTETIIRMDCSVKYHIPDLLTSIEKCHEK